jgi:hypothetical protein
MNPYRTTLSPNRSSSKGALASRLLRKNRCTQRHEEVCLAEESFRQTLRSALSIGLPDATMSSDPNYPETSDSRPLTVNEQSIEEGFVEKLRDLKYTYRPDIRDRVALETNFRQKFEALNRVRLTDAEFQRLHDELITPDVFTAARVLREKNDFTRDDGTPLSYTLVNIRDWCKNDFEVVQQLRINTDYSHHRYDVLLLINGVPVAQVELKTLSVIPRRAMEQIVDYKNDPGNGYSLYEPLEMGDETKDYFREILREFIDDYPFNPALFPTASTSPPGASA